MEEAKKAEAETPEKEAAKLGNETHSNDEGTTRSTTSRFRQVWDWIRKRVHKKEYRFFGKRLFFIIITAFISAFITPLVSLFITESYRHYKNDQNMRFPGKILEKTQASIVEIKTEDGKATGFIVEENGKKYVYTVRHAVMDRQAAVDDDSVFAIKKNVEIRSFGGAIVPIENGCECAITDGDDIQGAPWGDAVRFETKAELPGVRFSKRPVRHGDKIFAVGHRNNAPGLSVKTGKVTTAQNEKGLYVTHNAETTKGFSGGPIFDSNGDVMALDVCKPSVTGEEKTLDQFGIRLSVCRWVKADKEPHKRNQPGKFIVDYENGIFGYKDRYGGKYVYNCVIWRVSEDDDKMFDKEYKIVSKSREGNRIEPTLVKKDVDQGLGHRETGEIKIDDIRIDTGIEVNYLLVLANRFYFGLEGETNMCLAVQLWEVAAKKGNVLAQHNLGICHINGQGVAKDEIAAFRYFHEAADQDLAIAQYQLARCYSLGSGCERDESKEKHWLEKAAGNGLIEAEFALGGYCLRTRDYKGAIDWLTKAKEHGNPDAMAFLGECYQLGLGIDCDRNKALELYQNAVAAGSSTALALLGSYYLDEGKTEEAIARFVEARRRKVPIASFFLGYCYGRGLGVECDFERADKFLREAINGGCIEAMTETALNLLVKGDNQQGIAYLARAARLGDRHATVLLVYVYRLGIPVDQNLNWLFEQYRDAASSDHPSDLYVLGCCYAGGIGVKTNWTEAATIFQKLAANGLPHAQYELGDCYADGLGVESNEVKAVEWYRKAAENNFSLAQYELGWCYINGFGVATNVAKGIEWYQKASDLGYSPAQYELGKCYAEGFGVETNKAKAIEFYQKAAQKGYKDAIEALKQITSMSISVISEVH